MSETKLLIGSLSNDLYRSACYIQRGSYQTARRFLLEAEKWIKDLHDAELKEYVRNIITDLQDLGNKPLNMDQAEKYLTYSTLLQNYTLHMS